MKTTALFLSLTLAGLSAHAAIIHVDNNPNSPAPYSDIQSAVNAANSGDTIYVAGSQDQYSGFIVNNKAVHIIGAGYEPSKQFPNPTNISNATFTYNTPGGGLPTVTASGSSIEGCFIPAGISIQGYNSSNRISNIIVKRCKVDYILGGMAHSLLITNNIITTSNYLIFTNSFGIVVSNNIISCYYGTSQVSNMLVANNLFIIGSGGIIDVGTTNTAFDNNIFIGQNLISSSDNIQNCSFNNNIFYCLNNTLPSSSTNTFANNITGVNPGFVNAPGVTSPSLYNFDDTHNYNLASGSPGIGAGTNGANIGIFGGTYAWPVGGAAGSGFMYSQEANIPQVNRMDVLNSSVQQNGTLNVNVVGIINP